MDLTIVTYVVYLVISVALTVWVARTLSRAGAVFLADVFQGDERLPEAVNHLLVVGFYLVNLGYVSLQLKLDTAPTSPSEVIEALAFKVGLVLVVLGAMHFGNLFVFTQMRRQANRPPAPAGPTAGSAAG